ncbi:restriction endonuclease subunit S [Elizabethkingia anophelis]|nr:restriction endonuclease subunit S [Elizabethkingia anophelis]
MSTKTTYKQTELGLIPEDWEVKKLGEIGKIINGLTYSPENIKENGTLVLRSSNVQNDKIVYDDNVFVEENISFNPTKKDDVLICVRNGSRSLIGKTALLDEQASNVAFGAFMAIYRSNSNNYIYNYFKSSYFFKEVHKNLGATINSINNNDLKKFKIPLPPLPEQKKIADCLSTWDSAIEKQNALINALTDRKKALMQQLLTGKKRLPGFEGEWKEVKLGEVIKTFSGGTPKSTVKEYYIGDIPFIKSGEINSIQTEQFINEEAIKNSSAKKVIKGDLLYALYGATSGTVGISNLDGAINQAVLCIRTNENKFYLFYLLDHLKQNVINSFLQGGQGNLSSKIINELNVKLPSLSEQTAIAEILATADRELQLQKEKLAQLQAQKKGLMQVLLTGKKRLIN